MNEPWEATQSDPGAGAATGNAGYITNSSVFATTPTSSGSLKFTTVHQLLDAQPLQTFTEEPIQVDGLVYGWRVYNPYMHDFRSMTLRGSMSEWESGQMTASCGPDDAEGHLRVGACSCGIYGTWKPSPVAVAQMLTLEYEPILARCLFWGVIVEHEQGVRAQHCRIEQLFIPDWSPGMILDLENRYAPCARASENKQYLLEASGLLS